MKISNSVLSKVSFLKLQFSSTQLKGNSIFDFFPKKIPQAIYFWFLVSQSRLTFTLSLMNGIKIICFCRPIHFASIILESIPQIKHFSTPAKMFLIHLRVKQKRIFFICCQYMGGAAYDSIPWVRYISEPSIKCHKAIPAS